MSASLYMDLGEHERGACDGGCVAMSDTDDVLRDLSGEKVIFPV